VTPEIPGANSKCMIPKFIILLLANGREWSLD
jgi:hypothetical protein